MAMTGEAEAKRGVRAWQIVAAVLALVTLAALIAWTQRKPLAQGALDRALAARGVPARYRIASIGLRWERIEHVIIGDPRDPDLTADWAELRLSAGLGGVTATAIRAGGVRLKGRLVNGTLRLGALDRLLPAPSGKPFTLPDLDVDLSDARMRLDTPYGQVGMRLDGAGSLAGGFRGKLAAIAPRFAAGGCEGERVTAFADIAIANRSPHLTGPARAELLTCSGTKLLCPAMAIDAGLAEALDRWRGGATIEAARLSGPVTLEQIGGSITFAGAARDTLGTIRLKAATAVLAANRARDLSIDGHYRLRSGVNFEGRAAALVTPDSAFAASLTRAAKGATATPAAPLLRQLAASAVAARDLTVNADISVSRNALAIARIVASSKSGAVLHVEGAQGLRIGAQGFFADTEGRLSGGGFPAVAAQFRRLANGETRGIARVAPYASGGAKLVLTTVSFAASPAGAMRIAATATFDGPLGDGRVEGLRAPILALVGSRGTVVVNPGCAPLAFRSLAISGLVLNPATLALCPQGGAMIRVAGGRLSGGAA
ncbi:MAG: hypothetical protein H0X36_15950, partial [Sphingomonadaceae bacterium]|nr:hypothetical protein [Sphingomonadaceae bacterium]